MYNIIGFILVGILIGLCISTVFSIYLYRVSCPEYIEKETGIIWHLKTVASSCVDNAPIYVMESTKDAHVESMDVLAFKKKFKKKD